MMRRYLIQCSAAMLLSLCLVAMPLVAGDDSPSNEKTTAGKVEGWANVPGGQQVWLRPGVDAYEHDTGLVRDQRTGVKSMPLVRGAARPTSPHVLPHYPYPMSPVAPPSPPASPYLYAPYQPYALPTMPPPAYTPANPYRYGGGFGYDFGPGNVYYSDQPCNGCGAKLGSPGSINSRWTRVQ